MEPYHEAAPSLRASDQERDETVQRLQLAFAEGRLTDGEFDERMRGALAARTHADLAGLLVDLPTATAPVVPRSAASGNLPKPGRYTVAIKNSVRQAGRWRVPGKYRALVYKGKGVIDLRAAELTEPVTAILAVAYKSDIQILVPPGVRVETNGFGVTRDDDWTGDLPADAPVVHIRAVAYKGRVEARTTPER
ncbi:DUF1707 domain-containing protein [Actinoallomurus purpureus]|uniref:DUF1707 SHOCT-like domain-containing protein n=1 Tax=Actinoallomurus purpureus TaxID=478114 RepID=UPI002093B30E|nr:DUF1707 domain-containing protein [Actinoallomurus purpureus]MCO6007669.1 DUF1707 domain-containing protein [Actinoallomurus purpureus]